MTREHVWQLARVVDRLNISGHGLRASHRLPGQAVSGFRGVAGALPDEMREVRTICHCGRKATMVVRLGADGEVAREGAQIEVGGNEKYVSLCRRHRDDAMNGEWRAEAV